MANTKSELDKIRDHIRARGPTEIARRTKVSRRTLQYILSGKSPTYKTFAALIRDVPK